MTGHKIFPHGGPELLAEGIWRIRGELPFPLYRNMIVVKLPSGDLLLHSPVALSDAGFAELERLGRPAFAVVPHHYHQMDAAFYKARYPGLIILTHRDSRSKVAPRVSVSGEIAEVLPGLGMILHDVPGVKVHEYTLQVPLGGGGHALIFNDAFGGANATNVSKFVGRAIFRHLGAPGNKPGIARIYRWSQVSDVAALRQYAGEMAKIPDLRLFTMSHGDPVIDNPAAVLRAIAA